ncbi:hypothetical protein O1611_g1540 [Lasiodiplodia mahajangana]|uniref:Uncharacterized protein n=1 Tax=Lasiodiplodia mahajangana TaxID=1108764 RepID=A0ACC2JX47_9PEZI|nr:hypothetical protein O1611_g1540 [Lasiodiplodia mahajangana]
MLLSTPLLRKFLHLPRAPGGQGIFSNPNIYPQDTPFTCNIKLAMDSNPSQSVSVSAELFTSQGFPEARSRAQPWKTFELKKEQADTASIWNVAHSPPAVLVQGKTFAWGQDGGW